MPCLQKLKELITGQLAIAQDLGEKSRADGLVAVHWYDCNSPVLVMEKVMASSDSHVNEACTVEYSDQLFTRQARKPCHELIDTF